MKMFGGKEGLADRIISLMGPHTHYTEPCFGGGSVLLAKNPDGISETVNDIDGRLIEFWRVLASTELFSKFERIVAMTPVSKAHWEEMPLDSPEGRASAFFVKLKQSYGGMSKSFHPLSKNRTRRRMNEQVSSWLSGIDGLYELHQRMMRVAVLGPMDVCDFIEHQDSRNTLHYVDPPYLHETRMATEVYKHEMTEAQHRKLLGTLKRCEGKVVLSGYDSDLYRTELNDWNAVSFDVANHAASSGSKRRMSEFLWMNY